MNGIAEAISSIFNFLLQERKPAAQTLRLHNKEYAILRKAVIAAHNIIVLEKLIDEEKNPRKRSALKRKRKTLIRRFYQFLAQE